MRKRYDEAIEEGYQATERTNFYDSVYSPVILIVSAAVTALVFVLSASGNPSLRHLFGMSAGYSSRCDLIYFAGIYAA